MRFWLPRIIQDWRGGKEQFGIGFHADVRVTDADTNPMSLDPQLEHKLIGKTWTFTVQRELLVLSCNHHIRLTRSRPIITP